MIKTITEFIKKHIVLILIGIALLIRLLVAIQSNQQEVYKKFADDNARLLYARSIVKDGFIPVEKKIASAESVFAPIVPMVVAFKLFIFGESWLPLFILNAIIGTLSCYFIYLIAFHFFDKRMALFVLFWAALYPNYIRYIGTAGNEIWIVFFFAITFYYGIKAIEEKHSLKQLFLFSLSFILLIHTDERYLIYAVVFPLFFLFQSSSIQQKLKRIILFGIFSILFSSPWLIRNYLFYNDIVFITCKTTSITGHFIKHRPEVMFFDHYPRVRYLSPAQIDSVLQGTRTTFNGGKPIFKEQLKAMKAGNLPHEYSTIEKYWLRFYFLWVPFKFHDNYRIDGYVFNPRWSLAHNLLSILTFAILIPFMLFSFFQIYRKKRWLLLILSSSILLFHTLLHLVFIPYTRDRYRHPVDFIVIMLGCYGIILVYEMMKRKFGKLIQ